MNRLFALGLTSWLFIAWPVAAEQPTDVQIYGRYEWVGLPEFALVLKAKMDTGAYTSSLSAKDIEIFERDGEQWVRFKLATKTGESLREHRLLRISKIKNRVDSSSEADPGLSQRPVIELPVCLGDRLQTIQVNLVDRSHFNYPFLMGTKGLRIFQAAIDPSQRFTVKKPRCEPAN